MTTHTATAWELKGVAIAAYTLAVLCSFVTRIDRHRFSHFEC